MDNQDKIDAYLRGEMSEAERRKFEEKLKNDAATFDEILLTNDIISALEDRKHKLECIQHWQGAIDEEAELEYDSAYNDSQISEYDVNERKIRKHEYCEASIPTKAHAKHRVWYWMTGIGVAACLAIGIFITYPTSDQHVMTSSPYPTSKFNGDQAYRGGSTVINDIDSLINAKQYHDALTKIYEAENDYASIISNIAVVEVATEEQEYEKSLAEDELYSIVWRKINVLLALGKKNEAITILQYYRYQPGIYQTEANQLWEHLAN
jgi:hypothetical protein